MAAITLEAVEKRYGGDAVAVHNVSLEISDGELFVLLGPSGCGKSTLLNLIVGLDEPTSGRVLVDGRPMSGVAPGKRDMAMVFQSYAIYPHMSVRENLAFPLEIAGIPAEERDLRVARAAEILELGDLLDRRPGTLSGGQRQRVAMGRAIVRDPVAFLLDEPLSNLDARLRGQMRSEIARLHRRLRTTTIYVTHDQTEALTLADRMAVLRGGEVQQVGTPRQVYARPANRFVASFLGAPPMRFVAGEREKDDVVCALGRVRLTGGLDDREATLSPRGVRDASTIAAAPPAPAETRAGGGVRVDVGVRPGDLREAGSVTESSALLRFSARVELVEWLGAETYAHVEVEPSPETPGADRHPALVARLSPGSTVRDGDVIDLEVDARRLHVFDAATGARLGEPG